jgi:CheY-like chemotaxis protein
MRLPTARRINRSICRHCLGYAVAGTMDDVLRDASERGIFPMTSAAHELAGRRVLVIEDESMVMMLLQDMLGDIGCVVVDSASRFDEAIAKARTSAFDVAILDVNLNGERTFPIAEVLTERGQRFAFATGYGVGSLPPRFGGRPVLQKPFQQQELERVLRAALA